MTEAQLDEMGPIDYVVLEWADDLPATERSLALQRIGWNFTF